MPIDIPELTHKKACITGQGETLFLKGEIDDMDPADFLAPVLASARKQMGQIERLDFTGLNFLNASGIKCIVSFVMDKPPDTRIVFITDNSKAWQKTTLEVIQSIDEDNISIQETG